MNCPDCDTLMFRDECGCGFKVPRASTIEIKQVGAQETNFPMVLDAETAKVLSGTKLTGRPFAELCVKYCMEILKKASAKKEFERLQLKGNRHVN